MGRRSKTFEKPFSESLRVELTCRHYTTVCTSLLVRHLKQMLQISRSFPLTLALQLKPPFSDF